MQKQKFGQNGNSLAVFSSSLAELENLALLGVIYCPKLYLHRKQWENCFGCISRRRVSGTVFVAEQFNHGDCMLKRKGKPAWWRNHHMHCKTTIPKPRV
jgi:hypothetical protein